MVSTSNEDAVITDLFQSFNQDNVILFVGSKAEMNGELSEKVCSLPWSCIITTDRKNGFGVVFSKTRVCKRYSSFSELPVAFFNREELPIIQLYGVENEIPDELEEIEDTLRTPLLKKQGEKILNRVMSKMDIRSKMVVIGYDPSNDFDIPIDTFIFSWQELQGGTISFFNSVEKCSDILKNAAEKRHFSWIDGKLALAINEASDEYEIQELNKEDEDNVFYKGKKSVLIKRSVLTRNRNFVQLLTEEKINEIRPSGRIQQSRWFYNFLNNSADAPQWYGFLPQSNFYLKRTYEKTLFASVQNLLSNKSLTKNGKNTPVILEGDPGSSKSIELAALAYEIFCEKINPVIYINGDNLYFASQSSELQILDELMQEVEQVGEKDTRFLIVWDCSSYHNVVGEAKQLAHELENRGRRFVLVCSAYENSGDDKGSIDKEFYSYQENNIFIKSEDSSDMYYYNSCYFVRAYRKLDEKEVTKLKQKAQLYAITDKEAIEKLWNELAGETDIFEYFYRLIILLRPRLEAGLSREQRLINRYVNKQLLKIDSTKEEQKCSPIFEALKKAGISIDQELETSIEIEEPEEAYDLDKFNTCIAMYSRFKLDVPYSLALRLLCKNNDDYFGRNNEYNNYELFKLLTSQINYIHYCEQTDGNFVFKFRSTLEAEIFLKNNQVNEDKQINIIMDIINLYVESYRESNEIDLELKVSLQSILKMYGPNTEFKEFWEGHSLYFQHVAFLKKINLLADKLYELRTKLHVPDEDCGLALIEISFYRELYGNLWDKLHDYSRSKYGTRKPWEVYPDSYSTDTYFQRLKKLSDVSDLALDSLEKLDTLLLDTQNYQSQRAIQTSENALTVELAVTNGTIDNISQELRTMRGSASKDVSIKPLSYAQLYPILFKAISASPLNGYLYNALFKMFEKEYEMADEERRLYLLSDVRMIADDASTLEITDRGTNDRDELSIHIQKIAQYSCSYTVRIKDIISGEAPVAFLSLFKSMLARNNASGICFVCHQELDAVGLGGDKIAEFENSTGEEFILNQTQLKICERVVNFIKSTEYINCIEGSVQALYLLLRVEWMLFNGRPLSIGREWQLTYLMPENWVEISSTCEKYEGIAGNSIRPIVTLIYAMSKIHTNRDYIGATKTMHKVSDMPNQRMRVPYLICFEPGKPQKYNGTVMSVHNFSGFLKVDGLPRFTEQNQGVKFSMRNIGMKRMPKNNQILRNFELGLSMASQFSAHVSDNIGGENNE